MSLISKLKPKPRAFSLDAFFAAGHLFFCRRVELPTDLEAGEEQAFALLELEKQSPFPLEHLFYGFRVDAQRRHAFVFASYKRRYEPGETSDWLKRDAALPDFLVALGEGARDSSPLILVTRRAIVGLRYDERSSLPADFFAEPRPVQEEGAPADPGAEAEAFCERWRARLGAGRPRVWLAREDAVWLGGSAIFSAYRQEGERAASERFGRDEIWRADLRDPEMLEKARAAERQNALLWRGVIGVAAALALLLLGELFYGGSALLLSLRRQEIASRVAQVSDIQDRELTVKELRSFAESNLAPFQMIQELEPYRDPNAVTYRKVETVGPDTLSIEARAINQTQVTDFKRRVERFQKVVSVELSGQTTDSEGSTFTATVRFKPGAFAFPPEVALHE